MLARSVVRRLVHVRSIASTSGEPTGGHKIRHGVDDTNVYCAVAPRAFRGRRRVTAIDADCTCEFERNCPFQHENSR
ncbi:hypothetical protein Y032_0304g1934 [Ancylostoma ceylanicum]|uniref:Uncharacterized protein n=1 Tax=Ancylostoma ceylanicum TaxID=53326 RepID=A0A016S477_9BILA|nr:hypothetical protein Y032_0304g1934 [Ancylostoma ceylanicum]